jgi:hypothetical protein
MLCISLCRARISAPSSFKISQVFQIQTVAVLRQVWYNLRQAFDSKALSVSSLKCFINVFTFIQIIEFGSQQLFLLSSLPYWWKMEKRGL